MEIPSPLAEAPEAYPDELVIRPARGWIALNLGDLWRYRELIFFLAWRDISVRCKYIIMKSQSTCYQTVFYST